MARFQRGSLRVEPRKNGKTWVLRYYTKTLKREHGFENPTLDKTRRVMSLVYKHGQRYGLIPRQKKQTR